MRRTINGVPPFIDSAAREFGFGNGLHRFSFIKADRLLKRSEFLRLYRVGRRAQNLHFIATYTASRVERSRLGVTVSKKVGGAVVRNRLKRLTREYFRQNRQNLGSFRDIHLIAKREAAGVPSKDIFLSLEDIFSRIKPDKR